VDEKNYKENDFIADMLFSKYSGEKYLLNLKHVNVGESFVGVFKSYFELFQHINMTQVREELYIKDDGQKVWNIARFLPDNQMVAQWMMSTNNEILFWNIKSEYAEELRNLEYGTVFLFDEKQNDYLIYLGIICDEKYKFIRVTMDKETVLDMDYEVSRERFLQMKKATGVVPEIVCKISSKLINNPHMYFRWLFYWISFSKCGKEEQNRCMIQIISNKKYNEDN